MFWPIFIISLLILIIHYSICEYLLDAEDYDRQYRLLDEDADNEIGGFSGGKQAYALDSIIIESEDVIDLSMDVNSGCTCHQYHTNRYVNCFDAKQCSKFPRELRVKYNILRLSTTRIKALQINDLGFRNSHLESFIISENMEFSVIEPGAFNNMTNLKYIGIFSNLRLKYFEKNALQGCDNLKVLKIVRNSFLRFFDITIALQSQIVPNLKLLKLENVKIQNMTREDFDEIAGTNLHAIKLSGCDIKFVDPKIIIPLQKLKVLHFGENHLDQENIIEFIDQIISTNSSLYSIDLCMFSHLPTQILKKLAQTNVCKISFSCSTQFSTIENFPELKKITFLNLFGVSAVTISENAFKNLVNLETLILSQNYFDMIPKAALISNLINLDLSGFLERDKRKLIMQDNKFINMHRLAYLNLSLNNMARISSQSFGGLHKLEILDLQDSNIVAAENHTFSPLRNLKYLNLQKNKFPGRAMFPNIYSGLDNLKVLILTECGIQAFQKYQNIFINMTKLQSLRLDYNRLDQIYPYMFERLLYLEHIDLSNNLLKMWDFRIFSNNKMLRNLVSQGNTFHTLTLTMVEDMVGLQKLDLRDNKFSCTCDHFRNLSNLLPQHLLILLDSQPPYCIFPDDYYNTSIATYIREINSTTICEIANIVDQRVSILIGLATTLLVAIIGGTILVYIYRWHVKYWLFLAKIAMTGNGGFFKNKFTAKRSYRYDAFVSYCNEDREFVNHLISMLEPNMKLCVYERDFEIGTVISESVLESVADSRRTLLVISDAYIRSQWCRWEVQVAENHRLFFEDENGKCVNDTLIMIKLGDISINTIVSPMLRYLMKTRIYLEWDIDSTRQASFWRKLKRALYPSSKISKLI